VYAFLFVSHFERFFHEAFAIADIARNVHRRQEVHLDRDDAIPFARLATAALHVEREPARTPATRARFFGHSKEVADVRPRSGIRRRIAARRPTDGRLVDKDSARDVFGAREFLAVVELCGAIAFVEARAQIAVEYLVEECRFARARDTSNAHQLRERYIGVHTFQIELFGPAYLDDTTVGSAALVGNFDTHLVPQIRQRA
jgi:hypothetical protein